MTVPNTLSSLQGLSAAAAFTLILFPTDNGFKKRAPEDIAIFYDILKKNGVVVTRRREFGAGLKAACGQLRADYL